MNGKSVWLYRRWKTKQCHMVNENTISCDPLEQSNGSYYLYLIEINDKDDQSMVSFMNKIDGTQNPSKIKILQQSKSLNNLDSTQSLI